MAETSVTPGDPFTLPLAQRSRLTRAALVAARPFCSSLLGLDTLRELYRQATRDTAGATFEERALTRLDVAFRVRAADGAGIPPNGPLIVAANHPTGALDGLVLAEAVRQARSDVRVLANLLLARIPELRESCFFVDPFDGPMAASRSIQGMRAAHSWLRRGGALVMFPAGEVAWRTRGNGIEDAPWHESIGRLALATGATILPVFLDGRNSPAFRAAGRIHPCLRTLLLGRELLAKRGTTVTVHVDRPLPPAAIEQAGTAHAVTRRAQQAVDDLSRRTSAPDVPRPIASGVAPDLLQRDIDLLPAETRLLSNGAYDVFCAAAPLIPNLLREIGRLRETTFRAVGEGTGQASDLDRFDEHYEHLFVWHRTRRQVIGAYRVARTDRVLATRSIADLYTSTLFRYDERLVERLSPALELGRSFVRIEYQRSYNALFLLWKGIGQLVARAPEYRMLFGPVSISSRYRDTSQQMLRAYLTINHIDPDLAPLVESVNPPGPLLPPERGTAPIADVEDLDAGIRRLEQHQGIPVLLRQYLRLNATLLGFNVDPAFGDALDALMMVDLTRLPEPVLSRYLGREAARLFLARHAGTPASRAAA